MRSGENIISDFLELFGYKPKRFSKDEMKSGRAPDFKVYVGDDLSFYCEEKTFINSSGFYENQSEKLIIIIEKGSTKSNRLVHQFRESIKQFKAVNPRHKTLNIVAVVNHDETFFPDEIKELFQGYAIMHNDAMICCIPAASRKRISSELSWIDGVIVLQRIEETGERYNRFYYQENALKLHTSLRDLVDKFKKWSEMGSPDEF